MKNWQEFQKIKDKVEVGYKPIYLGMSILDLSKVHMYSFYYDVSQSKV